MKNILKILSAVFLLVLLQNCDSQKIENQNLNRKWMLISFKDYSKDFLIEAKASLDLTVNQNQKDFYPIFMGCNSISTKMMVKNSTIEFSELIGTEIYCEKFMQLETDFTQELSKMKSYKIDGHYLTLSNGKGSEMKFIAEDWD